MTDRLGTDMQEILDDIRQATERAKKTRNICMGVMAPDTHAAHCLAVYLAQIGQEFVSISVRLRQAGRKAADETAAELRYLAECEE